MNNNFNNALYEALEIEFSWLENFENPDEKHTFSPEFEKNMKKIFNIPEYTYVSVGRRRIRKSLLAVLVALFIIFATGCAAVAGYLIINWHETQNSSQGTLDVTFDVENGNLNNTDIQRIAPKTPKGYYITDKQQDETTNYIEYTNDEGHIIYYSQDSDVTNMSLSIDNENADFKETVINGYKGYSYEKEGVSELIWTDGVYLYILQGTCEMELLEKMSTEIKL